MVAGAAHEIHGDHGEQSGHNQHAGHSVGMFRDKVWLSLALTLPVIFWSREVQHELLSAYRLHRASGIALCPKFSWFAEYNIKSSD